MFAVQARHENHPAAISRGRFSSSAMQAGKFDESRWSFKAL
jgi:hypothetical protein